MIAPASRIRRAISTVFDIVQKCQRVAYEQKLKSYIQPAASSFKTSSSCRCEFSRAKETLQCGAHVGIALFNLAHTRSRGFSGLKNKLQTTAIKGVQERRGSCLKEQKLWNSRKHDSSGTFFENAEKKIHHKKFRIIPAVTNKNGHVQFFEIALTSNHA